MFFKIWAFSSCLLSAPQQRKTAKFEFKDYDGTILPIWLIQDETWLKVAPELTCLMPLIQATTGPAGTVFVFPLSRQDAATDNSSGVSQRLREYTQHAPPYLCFLCFFLFHSVFC